MHEIWSSPTKQMNSSERIPFCREEKKNRNSTQAIGSVSATGSLPVQRGCCTPLMPIVHHVQPSLSSPSICSRSHNFCRLFFHSPGRLWKCVYKFRMTVSARWNLYPHRNREGKPDPNASFTRRALLNSLEARDPAGIYVYKILCWFRCWNRTRRLRSAYKSYRVLSQLWIVAAKNKIYDWVSVWTSLIRIAS